MKHIRYKTLAITLALVTGLGMASFAQKKTTRKKALERWIRVYHDLWLGDQSNSTVGQFLKTATGQAILVDAVDKYQQEIAFVFFSEYQGNFQTLTFPGNAKAAATYNTDNITVFTRNSGGLNHWDQHHMNTGMITVASVSQKPMSQTEFNTVADSKNWKVFNKTFRRYSRSGKLSGAAGFVHVEPDAIYLFRLNHTVRGFIYVKNVIPKSSKGGSIKFDMIIEGSSEYQSEASKRLQPAKD